MSFIEWLVITEAWAVSAGAEHHAPSFHQIWFPLGNFLLFAFIINRYAVPLVRDYLRSRRQEVVTSIQAATENKQRAEALVRDYQARLARLDQEVQSIDALLRSEGEREKDKLLKEAELLAVKLKEDARFLADQEVKIARQQIRAEMADQAEATARELVQRYISANDQARLVADFIQSIGQSR